LASPQPWRSHLRSRSATTSRAVPSGCECLFRSALGSSRGAEQASRLLGPWQWPRPSPPVGHATDRDRHGQAGSVRSLAWPGSSGSSSSRTRIARDRGPGRRARPSSWTSLRSLRCYSLEYANFVHCRGPPPELVARPIGTLRLMLGLIALRRAWDGDAVCRRTAPRSGSERCPHSPA
jgi:hypothetical protein